MYDSLYLIRSGSNHLYGPGSQHLHRFHGWQRQLPHREAVLPDYGRRRILYANRSRSCQHQRCPRWCKCHHPARLRWWRRPTIPGKTLLKFEEEARRGTYFFSDDIFHCQCADLTLSANISGVPSGISCSNATNNSVTPASADSIPTNTGSGSSAPSPTQGSGASVNAAFGLTSLLGLAGVVLSLL